MTDLSLSNLISIPEDELIKDILQDNKNLEQIAKDDRHVRILIFRMLCDNIKAVNNFNKRSTILSCAIIALVIVELAVAIVV